MNVYDDSYLPDILHGISQGLLVPTMVCIIALLVVTVFIFGKFLVEFFTERRHYKQNMPQIINELDGADYSNITQIIADSQLLNFQKSALIVASRNMGLSEESLFALAQVQINNTEVYYQRRLAWTEIISKIAPLLGLMGTLIPLGPGIVALGQNDASTLSSALLLAFDATVCGLACAIISLIVSRIRGAWYGQYVNSLESLMSCVVDRASEARKAGIALPADYIGDPLKEYRDMKGAQSAAKQTKKRGGRTSGRGVQFVSDDAVQQAMQQTQPITEGDKR